MAEKAAAAPGVIESGSVYTLKEIMRRSGCGVWGLRQMRRAGLEVRYLGGKGFVTGAAFLAHLENAGKTRRS